MLDLIVYEKDGTCKTVTRYEEIDSYVSQKQHLLWLNIEKPSNEDMEFLQNKFGFHPLAIEDCMTTIQRPKIDKYNGYIFIVLHGATLGPHKDKATSLEVDIFLGDNFIVTVHMQPVKSITSTRERCMKNPQMMEKGPANILYSFADALVDNYFPILDDLDADIETMERMMITDQGTKNIYKILSLTEIVLTLKRFIGPQRDVVNSIVRGDYTPIVPEGLSIYFRDITDLLARITDMLDAYRDTLTRVLDGYTSIASTRLNEVMKVLTVIATIMMPLTLISGIYGMNFQHMPELEWKYGYFFTIFLMFAIGTSMIAYFKHKKWL